MTRKQFRAARKELGLTLSGFGSALSGQLGRQISFNTMQWWEYKADRIPGDVELAVLALVDQIRKTRVAVKI